MSVTLLEFTITRAGGYSLHVYCKYANDLHAWNPHHPSLFQQFEGQTESECNRSARRRGWILHKDGTSTCPMCARALRTGATP